MDSYILKQILICNKMRIFFLSSRYLVWIFGMSCLSQTCLDIMYSWCKSKSCNQWNKQIRNSWDFAFLLCTTPYTTFFCWNEHKSWKINSCKLLECSAARRYF